MAEQAAMGIMTMRKGVSAALAQRRKVTFFVEFTIVFGFITLLLTLLTGFVLGSYLGNDVKQGAIDDVVTEVREGTSKEVSSNLQGQDLSAPLAGAALERFDRFVQESVLSSRTVRVTLWNRDGTIVYSSLPVVAGNTLPLGGPIQEALAGDTAAVVQHADGDEQGGVETSPVIQVYAPLRLTEGDDIAGVLEVYRDYRPIAAQIASIQTSVYLGTAATLVFLYFLLQFLVKRRSNLIGQQRRALESQSQELKDSYESIVAVLCAALDLRDNVTYGHAQRVSELASVVAWQMGLRKAEVRQIEKAAILHDIGKIGVADAVLAKPGPLDDAEWAEMKRHPELGCRMLQGIDFLRDAAEIVHAHHEHYDGSGYPRGLKGDKIPLGARIFAVVDAYDAMTSYRPYRKVRPHRKAVEEIVRNSGSQFDPDVVRAFLEAEKRGLLEDERRAGEREPEPVTAEVQAPVASSVRD
jgi:putative nucleotidyltransferase with HDIG domain